MCESAGNPLVVGKTPIRMPRQHGTRDDYIRRWEGERPTYISRGSQAYIRVEERSCRVRHVTQGELRGGGGWETPIRIYHRGSPESRMQMENFGKFRLTVFECLCLAIQMVECSTFVVVHKSRISRFVERLTHKPTMSGLYRAATGPTQHIVLEEPQQPHNFTFRTFTLKFQRNDAVGGWMLMGCAIKLIGYAFDYCYPKSGFLRSFFSGHNNSTFNWFPL